ncbi:MAG: hypothetical protein UV61_C0009G0051 [Candidatus Gottesmanbacteria bacterium GW2011_GWB1_43_11]|uniref:CAAX prenyl protease 2/Lysostaphin resistance protein A-like domain-containing protein n=1 Tax=Candidatus Gottesmanbacteria bacterium GW2011_GWB1_43_11 TaxID=1618446 RepID=A0A0G1CLY7_9BACT|nr:MAG: hypothetical protein UV17_C0031G0023 [Candidatus Gottesmanbacteria bacterium GW2011_GWA1_42_26]KKS80891.1 MAG: hypothetical protein UV55_C0026G0001 [Candidatus Gottesmanbacteria bacterium GW2011_GWC1_43_10]KKS86524.1 MAG: hypothetical protein UV61_C0009G0051 [Candidatus Gottesmanbacteria bacterium GW2011_GWB1_43_11]OGG08742.1 MAG: hypothetical protein A2699_06525 [Candidatus Gottesmanbacteria bacterium RIFCSPHIGHO2_01_FULL_43_15]OGG28274.1 MAG: hypothetical protein A3A59_03615 [Candidat
MDKPRNLPLERTYTVWGIVIILWSLYRVYVKLPEWMDEFIFKPLIFLGPVLLVLKSEHKSLTSIGLAGGKFFRDIYLGLGFGMLFAVEGVVINAVKYGRFSFAPLVPVTGANLLLTVMLAFATGISEEVLTRGFFYSRLKSAYGSELKAMFSSTVMYFFLLVPMIFTVLHLKGITLLIFIMTNLIISFANTMIFNETKTVTVPVLIHAFWNMAVALYL